ncbi:MAG: hypothetical protein KAT05_10930 [Spirochaetes bacterium]|nr:hypothetical protein [Spirochaetota bacterium]
MKSITRKNTNKASIYVKLFALFPLIPVIIVMFYYIMPAKYVPYLVNLSGEWSIHEGDNDNWKDKDLDESKWKKIKLPGRFFKQGFKNKNYWITKSFTLKKKMMDEDLFLMLGRTRAGVGRVYINGKQVGEIGLYKIKRKTANDIRGLNGVTIASEYFKQRKNVIAIKLHFIAISKYNGINDQRLYIGVNSYLKKYFLKNRQILTILSTRKKDPKSQIRKKE